MSRSGPRWLLPFLALPLLAASPQRGLSLEVQEAPSLPGSRRPAPPRPHTAYAPAPLPNRDIDGPVGPRGDGATTVAPGFFSRSDTYRGEGFSRGSSAASDQDRRARPGAGINLKMPFTPN